MSRNSQGLLHLTAVLGATFQHSLLWYQPDLTDLDGDGQPKQKPVDLTGYTAVLTIARVKSPDAEHRLLRLTTNANEGLSINGSAGKLDVIITEAQMTMFNKGKYYWDAIVIAPGGTIYVWPQSGRFKVEQNISRSVVA